MTLFVSKFNYFFSLFAITMTQDILDFSGTSRGTGAEQDIGDANPLIFLFIYCMFTLFLQYPLLYISM